MNISDHISESFLTGFWVKKLKFFDADPAPDPGSGIKKSRNTAFIRSVLYDLDLYAEIEI
jgi:hypothetical protein